MRIIRNNGHLALIRGRLLNIHIIQHFTHTDRLNADSSHTKSTMIVFRSTVFRQILGLLKPIVHEDIYIYLLPSEPHSTESKNQLLVLPLPLSIHPKQSSSCSISVSEVEKRKKTESQSQRAIEENIDPNHKLK